MGKLLGLFSINLSGHKKLQIKASTSNIQKLYFLTYLHPHPLLISPLLSIHPLIQYFSNLFKLYKLVILEPKLIDQFQQSILKSEMEALLKKYHLMKKIKYTMSDRFIQCDLFDAEEWRLSLEQAGKESYGEIVRTGMLEARKKLQGVLEKEVIHEYLYDDVERCSPKKYISETYVKSYKMPGLRDNFYLNLVDWSLNDIIAAGVHHKVNCLSKGSFFVINPSQNRESVCSLAFNADDKIAIGGDFGSVFIIDIHKRVCITKMQNHFGRVASLNWKHSCVAAGSKDGTVSITDERTKKRVGIYCIHKNEVCGIKWSEDGSMIATGSNDKTIGIFDTRKFSELIKLQFHTAAVKALDWCPHNQGLLASGGGTNDRKIKFFDIKTLTQKYSQQTETQICNLTFSKISRQLVTTHGFNQNQINVWSYDDCGYTLKKSRTLHGHKLRVLYLAVSPKGNSILTGAADETLKIWNVFENEQQIGQLESSFDLR